MNRPVWYTFGNHFHWVDMQWLWGYGVLGASVRDMLAFTAATGARGNLNFDAVGYERMAAEEPEALAELRAAVAAGTVEIVGAAPKAVSLSGLYCAAQPAGAWSCALTIDV